jgi:hypothetical protein
VRGHISSRDCARGGSGQRAASRRRAAGGETVPHPVAGGAEFDKDIRRISRGLRELSFIEGRNITIEYRLAAGDTSRLPEMARELIRLPVDVIVTDGQKNAVVAHEATRRSASPYRRRSSPAPTRSSNEPAPAA